MRGFTISKELAFAAAILACLTIADSPLLRGGSGEASPSATPLDAGRARFLANDIAGAIPLFEDAVKAAPRDADAHAWLGEAYRRAGRFGEALATARTALAIDPCNAFAHVVISDATNPKFSRWSEARGDTSWHHALAAAACDAGDPNVWPLVWGGALELGDVAREQEALQRMIGTGFLQPALLGYTRWILESLPENAILLTNGDMDTYPALALQSSGVRKDVAIVNTSLLNLGWYRRLVVDRGQIANPFGADLELLLPETPMNAMPSDLLIRAWLDLLATGTLERPLTSATTLPELATSTDGQVYWEL